MNWIKGLLGIGAAAAAATAIIAKKKKTDTANKAMDEYLMPSQAEEDRIVLDAADWQALDEEQLPVQITFAADKEAAEALQDFLAQHGCSSSADAEAGEVVVLYTGDQPVEVLVDASRLPEVTYTGYSLME